METDHRSCHPCEQLPLTHLIKPQENNLYILNNKLFELFSPKSHHSCTAHSKAKHDYVCIIVNSGPNHNDKTQMLNGCFYCAAWDLLWRPSRSEKDTVTFRCRSMKKPQTKEQDSRPRQEPQRLQEVNTTGIQQETQNHNSEKTWCLEEAE